MTARHFALSAIGVDRPGIVAGVTGALVDLGCNLEDTSMSVLRGRFAVVMIVAGPESLEAEELEDALRPEAERLGLAVWAHEVDERSTAAAAGESWTVSVHGADHPGIVHGVAGALADAGANIVDLTTRVLPGDPAVYAMLIEVVVPDGSDGPALARRLAERGREMGVSCTMHSSDTDIL